jgi:glycine oxidase
MKTGLASYDLVVVGGGVQGLWLGRAARAGGHSVAILEAAQVGGGASGGVLGALMAHMPVPWGAKKQFQFDALAEMQRVTDDLTAQTGIDTGYMRSGRIMAIRSKRFRETAIERAVASLDAWRHERGTFRLEVAPSDTFADWLHPHEAPYGILVDTLAARIEPRQYVAALKTAFGEEGGALFEGWPAHSIDPARNVVIGADGAEIAGERIVVSAGFRSFDLARSLTGFDLGGGVKGQAVVVAAALPVRRPVIYDDGLYVVAHTREICAIGSTTEMDFRDPTATDALIAPRIEAARRLSPALREARVIGRWAGVRPKAWAPDPIIGPLEETGRVWIASGGFKITFGIAHALARAALDWMATGTAGGGLPASFRVEAHAAAARERLAKAAGSER